MSNFSVRVEILGYPTAQQYEQLHAYMEGAGFSRFIVSDDGRRFKLPPAEYDFSSTSLNAEGVRQRAAAAVAWVSTCNRVYVTEALMRAWSGLEPASLPASTPNALSGLGLIPSLLSGPPHNSLFRYLP